MRILTQRGLGCKWIQNQIMQILLTSISPAVGGCGLGRLLSSPPSQGQVQWGRAEVDLDLTRGMIFFQPNTAHLHIVADIVGVDHSSLAQHIGTLAISPFVVVLEHFFLLLLLYVKVSSWLVTFLIFLPIIVTRFRPHIPFCWPSSLSSSPRQSMLYIMCYFNTSKKI